MQFFFAFLINCWSSVVVLPQLCNLRCLFVGLLFFLLGSESLFCFVLFLLLLLYFVLFTLFVYFCSMTEGFLWGSRAGLLPITPFGQNGCDLGSRAFPPQKLSWVGGFFSSQKYFLSLVVWLTTPK